MDTPPDLLEWFRVDRTRGTAWLLGIGTPLVFLGASLIALGVVPHHGSDSLASLTLLGAVILVVAIITTVGGMTLLLAHDEYLAVRADGVLVHRSKGDVVLEWSAITGVTYDAERDALVFEAPNGAPYVLVERYSGAKGKVLADHLDELRRKAAMSPLDLAQVARIALGLPHKRPV